MLDTIDLKEQLERGNAYLQNAKKRNRRKWLFIITIIAVTVLFKVLSNQPDLGQIYSYQDGELIELAAHMPSSMLEIAPDGSFWAVNSILGQLYHYDGSNWQALEDNGFPVIGVKEMTFYENEVWVLSNPYISVFDGSVWTDYPIPVPSTNIKGFEVGQFGVAILDDLGNIAILQDGEWSHQNVADFLSFETYEDYAYLSMISDGKSLYLSGAGMAVFDGRNWRERAIYNGYTEIVGQDDGSIWIGSFGTLIALDKSTGEFDYYYGDVTGISDSTWIWGMQSLNGRAVFATRAGFLDYDGETWQASADLPIGENVYISDFALNSDGSLVVSTTMSSPREYSFLMLGIIFMQSCSSILPFTLFLPLIFYFIKANKEVTERRSLTQKRLASLLPDMPAAVSEVLSPKSKWGLLRSVLVFVLIFGISTFIGQEINSLLGVLVSVGAYFTWFVLGPIFNPKLEAKNRFKLLYTILTGASFGVILTVTIIAFASFSFPFIWQLTPYIGIPFTLVLFVGLLLYAFMQGLLLIVRLPYLLIMKPLFRGDFATALKRNALTRRFAPKDLNNLFQHGFILLELGNWDEAELIWRELLAEAQNSDPNFLSSCLINLANVLQAQGKQDEALKLFEAAVKIRPESPISYREMALWYLDQNLYPERALELTELMMHFDKKPAHDFFGERFMRACNLATRALALAQNQQGEAALATIQQAFAENSKNHFVGHGVVLNFSGDVQRALGNIEQAKTIYQEVLALKPSFSVHQFAAKALQEHDASPA